MRIHFLIEQISLTHLINEQQATRYEQLKQRKDLLIKELRQLMITDQMTRSGNDYKFYKIKLFVLLSICHHIHLLNIFTKLTTSQ
jgi:hypothetical protein